MDIVTKFEGYVLFDLAMVLRIGTHTLILNRFPTALIGKTNSKWSLQIFNFDKTKITLHQKKKKNITDTYLCWEPSTPNRCKHYVVKIHVKFYIYHLCNS